MIRDATLMFVLLHTRIGGTVHHMQITIENGMWLYTIGFTRIFTVI